MRDQFLQRLYLEHGGYWQSNGEGIDVFTRAEWATALDVLGGGSDAAFARMPPSSNVVETPRSHFKSPNSVW